jgi:hypothetical protein
VVSVTVDGGMVSELTGVFTDLLGVVIQTMIVLYCESGLAVPVASTVATAMFTLAKLVSRVYNQEITKREFGWLFCTTVADSIINMAAGTAASVTLLPLIAAKVAVAGTLVASFTNLFVGAALFVGGAATAKCFLRFCSRWCAPKGVFWDSPEWAEYRRLCRQLDVREDASEEEVAKAFRAGKLLNHPDKARTKAQQEGHPRKEAELNDMWHEFNERTKR